MGKRCVTFYVQGYVNGQSTDIALIPEKALPDKLDEAEWSEEWDAFVADEKLYNYIAKHSNGCDVNRIYAKERGKI
jgi:hypothetical protein